MKQIYLFTLLLLLANGSFSQGNASLWQSTSLEALPVVENANTHAFATDYELFELNVEDYQPLLVAGNKQLRTVRVPLPTGESIGVNVRLDQVIAPGLADRYPEIKTYQVLPQGKILGGRLGWTYQGLHATLRTTGGVVYIDPYYTTDNRYYVSYYVHENIDSGLWDGFVCSVTGEEGLDPHDHFPAAETIDMQDKTVTGLPVVKRKYRLAMSATTAFTNYHGGTVADALSAQVAIVNRLNEVFEIDLAVRVELVENNDKVIFYDGVQDPFPSNVPGEIFVLNQQILADSIGIPNYDMGHVVGRNNNGGEGIASLRGICRVPMKGQASSSRSAPQADPFTIDIVAHEMGHQFGANHTMSSCQNVNPSTSYEPGSGSTIMSYAGICPPPNNLQADADPYYHTISLQEIFSYTRENEGDGCAEKTDVGNTIPDVTLPYENGFYIPISTPFELTAEATDTEGDDLTYCWEGFDKQENIQTPPGNPMGNSPLFRTLEPTSSPTRVFPRMSRVVNNSSDVDEVLPTYSRNMTFRCTVRDNHPEAGGAAWERVAFFATAQAGPFLVMSPNSGGENWQVGDYTEVTWDVANTDAAPVNCQRVNIRLSTDGGYTYPYTLLADAPNTGSAFVTVPDAVSNDARIRVEAVENVFFDISNEDFSIEPATEPGYTLDFGPVFQSICIPDEQASVDFVTSSILAFDTTVALDIVSMFEDGIEATLSTDTIFPGNSFSVDVTFMDSDFDGPLDVELRAIAPGQDTFYRTFTIEVVNTDFSALSLLVPFEGESGINLSTPFSWTELPNAQLYDWELATDPGFGGSVLESAENLDTTGYTPAIILEENTLFFWRVRAINECGPGEWAPTQVFHTLNAICQEDVAEDTPINIPGTGPLPTRTSEINVPFDGIISDVNIPIVNVQYQPIQNFRISLISPGEIEVLLYDGNCFGTDRVNIGFDDDAPNEIMCPPDDNIVFRPVEALSEFVGQSSQGIWTLKVQVTESGFGASGAIDNWAIEFCASGNAVAPTLLTNNTLEVPPGLENPISQDLLEVESTMAGPGQLEYTLVSTPANGTVKFLGEEVPVGGTFRQSSINAFNVSYEHNGSITTEDSFTFVVRDGMGGFVPVQTFNIVIDENAVVNTDEAVDSNAFKLFPNPTADWVRLVLPQVAEQTSPVRIFDLQGRLVRELPLAAGSQEIYFDVSRQAAGVYLVQYGNRTLRLVKD